MKRYLPNPHQAIRQFFGLSRDRTVSARRILQARFRAVLRQLLKLTYLSKPSQLTARLFQVSRLFWPYLHLEIPKHCNDATDKDYQCYFQAFVVLLVDPYFKLTIGVPDPVTEIGVREEKIKFVVCLYSNCDRLSKMKKKVRVIFCLTQKKCQLTSTGSPLLLFSSRISCFSACSMSFTGGVDGLL